MLTLLEALWGFLGGPEALGGASAAGGGALDATFFSPPPAFFPPGSSTLSAHSLICHIGGGVRGWSGGLGGS